jgi:hypothetical protein
MTTATPLPAITLRLTLPPRAIRTRTAPTVPTCTGPVHGSEWAARRGCTCPDAREALRLYRKRYEQGTLPDSRRIAATGTRRRLQALVAFGYSPTVLGGYLGCTKQAVQQVLAQVRVNRATAARVAALYEPLSGIPPQFNRDISPSRRRYIDRAAASARARGWVPPIAWEDVDIDNPHTVPDRSGLQQSCRTVRAIRAAILELVAAGAAPAQVRAAWADIPHGHTPAIVAALSDDAGLTVPEIAGLLGINERTIARHRQLHRQHVREQVAA